VPSTFTPDEGLAFIHRQWSRANQGVGVSQAIVESDTDRAIGLVVVSRRPQPLVAGVGYWVVPAARRRGAASTALALVKPWSFSALDLRRLEAWVEPGNVASQQALLSAGFEPEGRLRNFFNTTTGSTDALVYSAIP
jgi:RimJ/RimL family protein N-acetyltransferase